MGFVHSQYGADEAISGVELLLIGLTNARLVCKSTIAEDEGKTITVSDGTTAYTGKFNSNLKCIFDLPGKMSYQITVTNAGITEFSTIIGLGAGEYKELEVGLNKNSWKGLRNIVNCHLETTYCNIGDEIVETLNTGEIVTYRIAAINHDQPHQLIFEPRYCLETARQMNPSNTNSGGWNASTMREWLNGPFLNSISDELKSVITPRTFKTSIGSQNAALQSATDTIWLPREWEIFGTTTYAAGTEHSGDNAAQFPIYAVADNRVKTYGKSGGSAYWWLSSPYVCDSASFCIVTTAGAANNSGASSAYGVAPCFQIVSSES